MSDQVVVFQLGSEEYAVPIEKVYEIIRLGDVRPIPQAPEYVIGLINLRGNSVPVIDLQVRFNVRQKGLAAELRNQQGQVLIVDMHGCTVGLLVEKVTEVRVLDGVLPPPPLVSAPFISGVVNMAERIIMFLTPDRIIEQEELQNIKAAG